MGDGLEPDLRARILAASGVTEDDIAALDPNGSYAAAVSDARRLEAEFGERAEALSDALAETLNTFVSEHGRYPTEAERQALSDRLFGR